MSVSAPWEDAPSVDAAEPWQAAPVVEPWESAPVVELPYPETKGALVTGGDVAPPVPDSGLIASFQSQAAKDVLNAASGLATAAETPNVGRPLKGRPHRVEDQPNYDALQSELMEIRDENARSSEGGGGAPDPREMAAYAKLQSLEMPPRGERLSGQLAAGAELAFEHYGADPASTNVAAEIGRGAGQFTALAPAILSGPLSLPLAVTQAASTAYGEVYQQTLKETGDELKAGEAASAAAVKTAPALAAYMVGGKLAATVTSKLLGATAAPIVKGIIGAGTATAANVAVGSTLRAIEGEDWEPSIQNLTMDTLFGVLHGTGEFRTASTQAKQRAAQAIQTRVDQDLAKVLEQPPEVTAAETATETAGIETAIRTAAEPAKPAPEVPAQPAVEQQSAQVEPHLRTNPEVERILSGEAEQAGPQMRTPGTADEGGFIFGLGKPKVKPKGATPRGDTEFLRIPGAIKRVFSGLEREGTADVIGKTKNKVGQILAKSIKQHVDTEQELFGQLANKFETSFQGKNTATQQKAFDELDTYFRAKENARPLPALSRDAQDVLGAWQDVAEQTGLIAEANNVQVFDPKTGAHRPMHRIGKDYFPRVFRPEVQRVMRDPQSNPTLWNDLVDAITAHKGITPDDAANSLRAEAGRFQANDFLGNLEMARTEQFPEVFYDYDVRQVASRYIPSFSERMAQIIAYGQRLGPRDAPTKPNLWDVARKESEDAYTQQWLRTAEDQSANLRPNTAAMKFTVRAQTLASGLLLSNPVTTVPRNLLSGISATAELLGATRSASTLLKTATSAQTRMDAREIGAVKERMADFLHADQLGESFIDDAIREVTSKALKYSGFNGSEVFVRSHGALTASQFAVDGVDAINANPSSRRSKEALSLFKRMGVDAKQIVAENADWKTGAETRKFIRTIIRDTQGGYRFDQVPLWANSAVGRFFYQYGRWGTQRARNIWNNGIKLALGTEVEWNGKKMTSYNPRPLLKMGASAVVLGEVFAGIAMVALGRDRKDATFKEIREAWKEDELQAVALASERMLNDVIMAGTLGIWSQPIDFAKTLKDQSRFKNPAEPPGLASIRATIELAGATVDQGGKTTKADWLRFAGSFVPGAKQVTDLARNVLDEPLYEAQNDVKTLRTAGRRWARAEGLDVPSSAGKFRKSENAPAYEGIQEALLLGDADLARFRAKKFTSSQKDQAKALKAVRSSVQNRQPFRVGPFTSTEHKNDFMKWAESNLPKKDFQQAKRVQERYERAAKGAGLL